MHNYINLLKFMNKPSERLDAIKRTLATRTKRNVCRKSLKIFIIYNYLFQLCCADNPITWDIAVSWMIGLRAKPYSGIHRGVKRGRNAKESPFVQ